MKSMTTTPFGGYEAAVIQVRIPAFVAKPRPTGGVRLLAVGGFVPTPSGPPLSD